MSDLLSKVAALQARGWTFDRSFQQVIAQEQSGSFGRPTAEGSAVLVAEAKTPLKSGQDTEIAKELAKHRALRETRESTDAASHVARLQKIRDLMTQDPSMSWDSAFTQTCLEETQPAAAASQPSKAVTPPAVRVEAQPKGTHGFVADGSRHPWAAVAKARGLNLIEGGLCGLYVPLSGDDETSELVRQQFL